MEYPCLPPVATLSTWTLPPNNSFKPNLFRYGKSVAKKACHAFASTTQVGLTQALDHTRNILEAMKTKALIFLSLLLSAPCFAAPLQCEADALAQAEKLLAFHSDGDNRAEIVDHAKSLPSIVNPANKKQRFLVLEVMGYVYKGNYRMRFLYYPIKGDCLFMGQEILELSSV